MKSTNNHPNYCYIYNMTCWPSSSRCYKICVITWWMESPAVWMTLSMCMWVRGSFLLDLKLVHLRGCCRLIDSWRQESLFFNVSSWVDSLELAAFRTGLTVPDCSLMDWKQILSVLEGCYSIFVEPVMVKSFQFVETCWNYHQ